MIKELKIVYLLKGRIKNTPLDPKTWSSNFHYFVDAFSGVISFWNDDTSIEIRYKEPAKSYQYLKNIKSEIYLW
jgi:hypothetical protein